MPLLGDSAIQVQGFSWIIYDVWQFMKVNSESSQALVDIHTRKALLPLVGWNHLRGLESLFTRGIWFWRKFPPGVVTITGSLSHSRKNTQLSSSVKPYWPYFELYFSWWMMESGGTNLESLDLSCGRLFLRQRLRRETNGGIWLKSIPLSFLNERWS